MTTQDYLEQLQQDKADLVDNLTEKGITGLTGDETFTELVPEVLNIPSGGGKYTPKYIGKFTNYTGSDLDYEVTNLDVSELSDLKAMFMACSNITKLDLSGWNNTKIDSLFQFCSACSKLVEIDLSSFVGSNILVTGQMFKNCTSLQKIDARKFNFWNITNSVSMFDNVPANCLIIVSSDYQKSWFTAKFSWLTNVKTVFEYEDS